MGRVLPDLDVTKHPFLTHELLNLRRHCACSVILFLCLFELLVHRHANAAKLPKSLDSYDPLQLTKQQPFHVRERTGRGECGRNLRHDGLHGINNTEASARRARHRVFRGQKPWQENSTSQFENPDHFGETLVGGRTRGATNVRNAGATQHNLDASRIRLTNSLGHETTSGGPDLGVFLF